MENVSFLELVDVIGELFSDEVSIAVSSTTHYLYYRSSKRVDLRIRQGDRIKEGTLTHKALQTGEKVSDIIERDMFGIPYHGLAVPLFHNGKIIGCMTGVYPAVLNGKSVITVKTNDGWKPIPFKKVHYIEASNKRTFVHGSGTSGIHKNSLQEFEYLLPREGFIRCHRSYIVNVNHITEIYPDSHSTFILLMDNGARIPVSQTYSTHFRRLLHF